MFYLKYFLLFSLCIPQGLKANETILWTVKWKPDGKHFAVGGTGKLDLFDKEGQFLRSILPRYNGSVPTVTDIDWHKSENLLAISSQNGDVNGILDLDTNTFLSLGSDHTRGIEWSPDHQLISLSSAGDGHLRIWDVNGKLLKTIIEKNGVEFRNVAWNPAGDQFASTSHSLFVWSEQGEKIHEGKTKDMLWGLDWHPGGESIITSSEEGNVRIWNKEAALIKMISVYHEDPLEE